MGGQSVFDLHVHTNRGSVDSSLTPEEMVREAARMGLAGIMVTEHQGWPRKDFEAFARDQSIVLAKALEVYTPLGHIIALGLETHIPMLHGGLDAVAALRREVDGVGGFLIMAHPFRFITEPPGLHYTQNILFEDPATVPATAGEAARHPVFELVHEIEVVNGATMEPENRFAQGVAKELGFSGTGGSDAHSTAGLGKGCTVFNGEVRNARDLLDALRARDFFPVEGFHVSRPMSYGNGAMRDGPMPKP